MRTEDYYFLLAFVLATLNDIVDLLGLLIQPYETIFDMILAVIISLLIRRIDIWSFLITIIDAIPSIDLMPIWFLYVLYRYIEFKERRKKIEERERVVKVPVE